MDMRDVLPLGAKRLPTLVVLAAIGSMFGAPVTAQRGSAQAGARPKGDSVVTIRVVPGSLERRLRARVDSLRVVLDREPIASADREQLRAETEQLMKVLSELSRTTVEFNARVASEIGAHVTTVIARGMAEGGIAEGLRRFQIAAPRGWIGIVAEAPNEYRIASGNQMIRYLDYPSIISVDPNSPAARAGINAGDVLIAYDRADVRNRDINLSRLLIPDRRLAVTVRRDGEMKDYEMTVARASDSYIRDRFVMNAAAIDTVRMGPGQVGKVVAPAGGRVFTQRLPDGRALLDVGAGPARILVGPGTSSGTLWGAQLASVGAGLARTLGVTSGVLVLSVVPATPADRSGLDDGDIIVKADGQPISSVAVLWRMTAERDAEHMLELEVLRAKKPVKVTLRWAR
jgi:serine protease Do